MKTNSNLIRFGALALVCGVATAFAGGPTTATRNMIESQVAAYHSAPAMESAKTSDDPAWFGAIAENWHAPAGRVHHSAPDVKLAKVYRDSPAYAAGLRPGDVIWRYDGQRLMSAAQFKHELRSEKPGEMVPVEAFHHGRREDLKVKLGDVRTAFMPVRGTSTFIEG